MDPVTDITLPVALPVASITTTAPSKGNEQLKTAATIAVGTTVGILLAQTISLLVSIGNVKLQNMRAAKPQPQVVPGPAAPQSQSSGIGSVKSLERYIKINSLCTFLHIEI